MRKTSFLNVVSAALTCSVPGGIATAIPEGAVPVHSKAILTDAGMCEAVETSKCTASDGQNNFEFGGAVAISGNRAIVGAKFDNEFETNSGAAYIYHLNGDTWEEQPKVKASDPGDTAHFGHSVALDGDVAIVGAPLDHDSGSLPWGAAYIFRYDGSDWNEEQKLVPDDLMALHYFGWSVAIQGDVAVVGAFFANTTGAAYVFRYDGQGQWTQEKKLTAPDGDFDDQFGISVAIDGNVILTGAHHDDNVHGSDAGSVYVFHWVGEPQLWSYADTLHASDGVEGAMFGSALSLSGSVAVVAANNDQSGWDSGAAYVFRSDGNTWSEEEKFLPSPEKPAENEFAFSIGISGDVAVVSAMRDNGGASTSGSAYIYHYDGAEWAMPAKLMASDGATNDRFGASVSISGDMIIVGARQCAPAGAAYVFNGLDDGVPDSCAINCLGDATGDGIIGIDDFLMVLGAWGPNPGHPADFNGDGQVGIGDFLVVLGNWGSCS